MTNLAATPRSREIRTFLLITAILLTFSYLVRLALSFDSILMSISVAALTGVVVGFGAVKADAGHLPIKLSKRWFWVAVVIAAVTSTFYSEPIDRTMGAVFAGGSLLSAIASFAFFHLRMAEPQ